MTGLLALILFTTDSTIALGVISDLYCAKSASDSQATLYDDWFFSTTYFSSSSLTADDLKTFSFYFPSLFVGSVSLPTGIMRFFSGFVSFSNIFALPCLLLITSYVSTLSVFLFSSCVTFYVTTISLWFWSETVSWLSVVSSRFYYYWTWLRSIIGCIFKFCFCSIKGCLDISGWGSEQDNS